MRAKREQLILFMNTGTSSAPVWSVIGRDIEDLSRTMNYDVQSKNNILGEASVDVTKGPQTTTVDPVKMDNDDPVAERLYDIYAKNLDGSDVENDFVEVSAFKQAGAGEYEAFRQNGAISLTSFGGDTTGVNAPFEINWKGERVAGTFNPTTKTFTPAV